MGDILLQSQYHYFFKMIQSVFKKIIGFLLIIVGIAALVTPFTPGSWLIFVGMELLGFRMLFWNKIKSRFFSKNGSAFGRQKRD
ncbi:MAG: PGPGW domain-containing protein [Patescibacteria group bacterium]